MLFGLAKYQPLRIDAYDYDYPLWGHIFGWFLSLSSMLCIPVYGVYLWITTDGTTSEVLPAIFIYSLNYSPSQDQRMEMINRSNLPNAAEPAILSNSAWPCRLLHFSIHRSFFLNLRHEILY